jgi:flagellar motor protein MotB
MMTPAPFGQENWQAWEAPQHAAPQPLWMLSFADLTALMVCFFILLFSLQSMDRPAWEAVRGSLRSSFAPDTVVGPVVVPGDSGNAMPAKPAAVDGVGYLKSLLQQGLTTVPGWQGVEGALQKGPDGEELVLPVPAWARTVAAWAPLAEVVRSWNNPMRVRVRVPTDAALGDVAEQLMQAALVVQGLRQMGVADFQVEVWRGAGDAAGIGPAGAWELVVAAE